MTVEQRHGAEHPGRGGDPNGSLREAGRPRYTVFSGSAFIPVRR